MSTGSPTRRGFLRMAGAGAALAGVGCDDKTRRLMLGSMAKKFESGAIEPFTSPQGASVDLISHVISRLTWGAAPGDYQRVVAMGESPEQAVAKFIDSHLNYRGDLAKESSHQVRALEEIMEPLIGEMYDYSPRQLNFELTKAALWRAVHSPHQLYEVMVSFWSDHFNIDSSKADCRWLKPWDDREVIRKHALGNFAQLLRASALSPAMLFYLDGRANKRCKPEEKPNENYARELMELHTLGVHGGYTQADVMEAARCLTGWTVDGRDGKMFQTGKVKFLAQNHDDGEKTVLGVKIPAGGKEKDLDKLLEIVTTHPSTSKFVAEKLCRRFVADEPKATTVSSVASAFAKSGGDIRTTLKTLFATEEFLDARGTKFKRPFHFLVSALRAVGSDSDCGMPLQLALRRMGHMPFDYPTPEGYSDKGADWMSTLLARWDIALRLGRGQVGDSPVKVEELAKAAGGEDGVARHILKRSLKPEETEALAATEKTDRVALLLAMPDFQLY